jgi:hypothetical protein
MIEEGVLAGRHPIIGALSRKQPSGDRRTAQHEEKLSPVAVSHEIGRPLDRLLRGPARSDPQVPHDLIQHRMTKHREFDVFRQKEG